MLYLAALLFILAVFLFWRSNQTRKTAGLPGGRVIYSDASNWGPVEEPLYDPSLGLVGRPDYLIRQGELVIPVEVKSGHPGSGPYDGHIYQLAAYCLLVESAFGQRPAYGILHYSDKKTGTRGQTFAIDFTPELEQALLELLSEMRTSERRKSLPRSHESQARCNACGFRTICDERL